MKDNGTMFMLIGGAALLFWYMSQQDEDSIAPTPYNPNAPVGKPIPPTGASPDTKGPFPVPKEPPTTQNASDPIVPLPARLVRQAGTGSQTVDEWNWHYQHLPEIKGAEQPDPNTFMPEGYDRSANISATDYVRYRGLGRVSGSRYQAQASRIVRQSTF